MNTILLSGQMPAPRKHQNKPNHTANRRDIMRRFAAHRKVYIIHMAYMDVHDMKND